MMDETMMIDDASVHPLIVGIVKQAVYDWKNSRAKLKKHPTLYTANVMLLDCENFFTSPHFSILTGLYGQAFLDDLILHEEEFHKYDRVRKRRTDG